MFVCTQRHTQFSIHRPLTLSLSALICSAGLFLSSPVFAMPSAPQATVADLARACEQLASEERIHSEEKAQFILECVNDQLTELGYARINSL
ncbi:hypothetical protein [Shewanella maritima]|uniref:hypothetical protein n=1 Tax=Shewanella maritima TaxID=2520507 RepID=UPI003735779B